MSPGAAGGKPAVALGGAGPVTAGEAGGAGGESRSHPDPSAAMSASTPIKKNARTTMCAVPQRVDRIGASRSIRRHL